MPYGSADVEQSMQQEIDLLKKENAALKAELAQLSHNTGSPKLPNFIECMSGVDAGHCGGKPSNEYSRGAKEMYDYIIWQLRAGA